MSVYMLIQTKEITNHEIYAEYISKARPIIESYGGKYRVSTDKIRQISAGWNPQKIIIIEFPDMNGFDRCFGSEEYKKIVHLRKSSVIGESIVVESL